MEQPIPEWLDADFMTQCLRHEKDNPNVIVTNLDRALAAPAGNNYGACVVRVTLQYKDNKNDEKQHQSSLIVKSELTVGAIKDLMSSFDEIEEPKEPAFYNRFLAEVKKITNTDFAPKSLFSPKFGVTVLEDLKEQGFVMADRLKQLDFEHCRLYMEAAAAFHASSFALHKLNPKLIETLGKQPDMSKVELFPKMIRLGLPLFANATAKIERFKKYQTLIEDFTNDLWSVVTQVQKPSDFLKTLIQGDPWVTNMMFRYNGDDAVCEVKLLDFQGVQYTSPVNDVVFFIWSSATTEVRLNRRNDLYHIYIESFNKKMAELKCSERITNDSFMGEVKRLSPLPFYMITTFTVFFIDPKPFDYGIFSQEEAETVNPYNKYYTEDFCQNVLPSVLEQLETLGIFECMEQHRKKL